MVDAFFTMELLLKNQSVPQQQWHDDVTSRKCQKWHHCDTSLAPSPPIHCYSGSLLAIWLVDLMSLIGLASPLSELSETMQCSSEVKETQVWLPILQESLLHDLGLLRSLSQTRLKESSRAKNERQNYDLSRSRSPLGVKGRYNNTANLLEI